MQPYLMLPAPHMHAEHGISMLRTALACKACWMHARLTTFPAGADARRDRLSMLSN
jgi:hypothetical protein